MAIDPANLKRKTGVEAVIQTPEGVINIATYIYEYEKC